MFLPTTLKEVRARGWDQLDVILFTGDAYIDHPSFGAAVVGRLLEAEGYRVAIVPQPNWRDDLRDFTKLGTPRLFFGVTAGAMDSMVNHYTANIRLRSNDAYTPGGKAGFRPDYAVKTYTQILKRLFPRTPVVIGGIESSLRRLTHYDYWSDSLHPSILADSGADLLIYGMGERVIQQVARAMNNGFNAKLLRNIRQVGFMADRSYVERLDPTRTIRLHSYEECVADKRAFGKNFTRIETLSNLMEPDETLVEGVGDRYAVITPPNATLTTEERDHSFDLPYERAPHPRYRGRGDIPAWEMIKHSVNIHRGCFGGCSFCTISAHQGKFITSRSEKSILREVERVTRMPDFRGYLSDIGAPSANMYRMGGRDRELCSKCRRASCLHPKMCPNLDNDHRPLLDLYAKVRAVIPAANCQTEYDEYTPDGSDYTYISSHSRWQSWADFDRVIHALFTDTFWSDCNDDGNAPIYIEHDGRLFILDCAYGDQYYNSNIPDEFTLTAQTDNRIDFTVTAHYSYPYPRQDETEAERDDRLETSYEYTRTYPVTLIYTDAGWRFDAFTTPNQADMQLLGEWDGVEETDFYLPDK